MRCRTTEYFKPGDWPIKFEVSSTHTEGHGSKVGNSRATPSDRKKMANQESMSFPPKFDLDIDDVDFRMFQNVVV